MKKFLLFLIPLCYLMSGVAYADWTITADLLSVSTDSKKVVQIDLVSDAEGTSFDLFDQLTVYERAQLKGKTLQRIATVPGADDDAPSAVYDITISDLFDTATFADRSVTATQVAAAADASTAGLSVVAYGPVTIAVETLGDTNTTVLYLEFE